MSEIHNALAERVVLASLMAISPAKWANLWPLLHENLFVDARHRDIFRAIRAAYDAGIDPEAMVVLSKIEGMADTLVTEPFLCNLINNEVATLSGLQFHIDELSDTAIRRQLEALCLSGMAAARDRKANTRAENILHELAHQVTSVQISGGKETHLNINEAGKRFLQRLEEKQNKDANYKRGIRSGLVELDNKAMIEDGDLVIIGARPSMGKTTLMQNYIINNIIHDGNPTLVMSAEMSSEAIYERMANALGQIHAQKTRTGQLDDEDWQRLTRAMAMLDSRPMQINDKSAPSLSDVRNSALKLKAKFGRVGAILIDYLQLMSHPVSQNENETQKITEISKGLKAIAKEFSCPVIALSQLNRSLENRPNKRPIMSDIRQSGGIEQDADLILFLYRDEFYNKDTQDFGIAEIIIGKQRNGPTGVVRVASVLEYCQFANLDVPFEDAAA